MILAEDDLPVEPPPPTVTDFQNLFNSGVIALNNLPNLTEKVTVDQQAVIAAQAALQADQSVLSAAKTDAQAIGHQLQTMITQLFLLG